MKNFIIKLLFKSLTIENISALAARCIVWLLEYARNKGDKYWDTAKEVIRKINNWCSLFLEVYEDDALTEEEEAKIAEAISKETNLQSIAEILNKRLKKRGRKAKNEKKGVKRVAKRLEISKRGAEKEDSVVSEIR